MRKIPLNFCPKKESLGSNPISRTLASIMAILSGFSHWRKETHTRVFDFEEENIAILYASGRNKWEAIANVMLMTRLYAEGYTAKYISLKCKPGCKHFLTEIHEVSKKNRQETAGVAEVFHRAGGSTPDRVFFRYF